ncbi:MAG: amidohydrolase family protein [Albidovulum sp.]|nr:amidohydrolase family protein [Albidovulum sp.]
MAKEIAFALDLKDEPDNIRDYCDWHRRVWPEIMRGMAKYGVITQNIYLIGNRLFMVLRVEDDFDYRVDFARYLEETPRAKEWDSFMHGYQQLVPWAEEGDWWAPMERVYDLNARLAEIGGDPRPLQTPGPALDTHHHLWKPERGDYFWMAPELPIARDYMPEDLAPLLRQAGVDRTILVQAADTEAETDFMLGLAADTDWIAGVCGWLDMDSDDFPARLAHYMANPIWKSFRPMLQDLDEPDWILKPRVLKNLAHAAEAGARFEVLTRLPQLPYAVEAIKRTPGLKAVVNHISKPDIAGGVLEPWASQIAELRDFPEIYCKVSGLVTEADPDSWNPDDLRPYVAHVLDVFGPDRVMFGSDWPVALMAASSYGDVMNAVRSIVGPLLDISGHRKFFRDNGVRFYGL